MTKTKLRLTVIAASAIAFGGPAAIARAQERATQKANLDLPFDAGGQKDESEEEAPEIVVFYGQQYEGDGIFFCCDKSGSMNVDGKFKRLQCEVTKDIAAFSERVQFGIVFFDTKTTSFPKSGRPADASPAMKAAATAFVAGIVPGHGSCEKSALAQCFTYAAQSSAKRKLIFYISDGSNFCPGYDVDQYSRENLAEVRQRNTFHVRINTIFIGSDAHPACLSPGSDYTPEAWMRKLASQNDGTYTRIVQ